MRELIERLFETNSLERGEIARLIREIGDRDRSLLFKYSRKTVEARYSNRVYMRGLIEFSNVCARNCMYCGLRRDNANVERYRLSKDDIMSCCDEGYLLGYRTFVLQSGEDPYFTVDMVTDIVRGIKAKYPDTAVTLSIGEKSRDEYKAYFDAGADRYLLRHESASRAIYERLHPGMSFDRRIECLKDLKEIGFQVGAGFMTGLPSQTPEDLAEDLAFLMEFQPHMIGIGPFIPHSETPLSDELGGNVDDTLLMVALARLLVPDALIPATTALGTLSPRGRELALLAGANVVMPNITPTNVRVKYELYENKICTGDEASHCRQCIQKRIESSGLSVDMGRGDSVR